MSSYNGFERINSDESQAPFLVPFHSFSFSLLRFIPFHIHRSFSFLLIFLVPFHSFSYSSFLFIFLVSFHSSSYSSLFFIIFYIPRFFSFLMIFLATFHSFSYSSFLFIPFHISRFFSFLFIFLVSFDSFLYSSLLFIPFHISLFFLFLFIPFYILRSFSFLFTFLVPELVLFKKSNRVLNMASLEIVRVLNLVYFKICAAKFILSDHQWHEVPHICITGCSIAHFFLTEDILNPKTCGYRTIILKC